MGEVRPSYKNQAIYTSVIAFNRIYIAILNIYLFFIFTLKFERAIFA